MCCTGSHVTAVFDSSGRFTKDPEPKLVAAPACVHVYQAIFRIRTDGNPQEGGTSLTTVLGKALQDGGFTARSSGLIEGKKGKGDPLSLPGRKAWWFYEFPHTKVGELETLIDEMDTCHGIIAKLNLEVVYGPTYKTPDAPVIFAFVNDSKTRSSTDSEHAEWPHCPDHYTGDEESHYHDAWMETESIDREVASGDEVVIEAHAVRAGTGSNSDADIIRDKNQGDVVGDHCSWVTFTLLGEPKELTDEDGRTAFTEEEDGFLTKSVGNPSTGKLYKSSLLYPEQGYPDAKATADRSLSVKMLDGKAVARFKAPKVGPCGGTAKILVNTGDRHRELLERSRDFDQPGLFGSVVNIKVASSG